MLTVRKCGGKSRHFQADRRDARRELPAGGDGPIVEAIADEPSPEEAALLVETTEGIMHHLGNDRDRRIFELSLQGYSIPDISAMVGYYERGVERVRAKVKIRLEAMLAAS